MPLCVLPPSVPEFSLTYVDPHAWHRPHALTVWSNFEIASMDFWRSEAYSQYFEYLDSKGGFYYEVRMPPSCLPFLSRS